MAAITLQTEEVMADIEKTINLVNGETERAHVDVHVIDGVCYIVVLGREAHCFKLASNADLRKLLQSQGALIWP